jgi:hypothetical protein
VLFFGGAESFRGVPENFFPAEYYCILGNELGVGKKNNFFFFGDSAYDNTGKNKFSFGLGTELTTGKRSSINLAIGFYEKIDIENGILHILWKGSF